MRDLQHFSWKDPRVLWHILIIGSVYFLWSALYSIVHYQEKFLLDGTSLVFHIANFKSFPYAAQREVMFFQQFIPVALAIVGAPLKWIMIAYVANVYLFYFCLFVITSVIFKDSLSSLFLILLHFKGDPYNYFMMVEELLPGVCILIVLLSIIRNFAAIKSKYLGYTSIAFLLLCVIRSHPLALLCLPCGLVVLLIESPDFYFRNKKAIIWLATISFLLLTSKYLWLNSYDIKTISNGKSVLQSFVELLNPGYLGEMVLYLFYLRKIFTITFSVTIVYLIYTQRYIPLGVFLLLVAAITVIFNTQVNQSNFQVHELSHLSYDRWSLPVRFVVFSAFSYWVLKHINDVNIYKITGLFAAFYFALGLVQISEEQERSQKYIRQAQNIIECCRATNVSKAMLRVDDLENPGIVHHNCFQDIMVMSSLNSPDSCIQVVYVSDKETTFVKSIHRDQVLLHKNEPPVDLTDINSSYFQLDTIDYQLVSLRNWASNGTSNGTSKF